MLSETARDYLEAIYNITVEGDAVVGARLAVKFAVSAASVAEMLGRLRRDGYVTQSRATGPLLTPLGMAEAEASLRHHRLAERFLFEVLGMDWIGAHEEAHALQHALTPAIEARMVAVLGQPATCPHGNPIPGSGPNTHDFLRGHQALRLSAASAGELVEVLCISEVVEDETALLHYLGEKGVKPGVRLVLEDRGPGGAGPLMLSVDGASIALGREVAEKIWVCRDGEPRALGNELRATAATRGEEGPDEAPFAEGLGVRV